jgi:hypothetical protein
LEENLRDEWRQKYVDYNLLKDLIKDSLSELERDENSRLSFSPRTTSLTVQRPNRGKKNSEELFFAKLEEQVRVIMGSHSGCNSGCVAHSSKRLRLVDAEYLTSENAAIWEKVTCVS